VGPTIPLSKEWLERHWHLLFCGKWSQKEHNNILELRTGVATLRHLSRTSQAWGHRIMIFTYSLVCLGALQKRRSSVKDILHLCRIGAIIQMVCRIRGYYRWVSLELNLADGPSRGLPIGAAEETVKLHVSRGVPQQLQRLLHQRQAHQGTAAGSAHVAFGMLAARGGAVGDQCSPSPRSTRSKGTSAPPPLAKKGARAWGEAQRDRLHYTNRLVIHAVDDATNLVYQKAVREFLVDVKRNQLDFDTFEARGQALADYISDMCYVRQLGFGRANVLLNG
jgi:hypothetical protein